MSETTSLIENRPPSVAHLLLERVAETPDTEAYRYPVDDGAGGTQWRSLTWAQALERIRAIAAGLMDLGVRPEERVAIASSTRIEWILADFGVMCAGAAVTTVYPNTNTDETHFILSDSASRVLIAENATQLDKALQQLDDTELAAAVLLDDDRDHPDEETPIEVLTLARLEERGSKRLTEDEGQVERAVQAIDREQLATLIYTSGTTGRPKGVRLVHDCWSYEARAVQAAGLALPSDVQYLWLPLAHVFGKVLTSVHVAAGFVTAVDGRQDKIVDNLPQVRPTFMVAVPRVFEKVYNGVAAKARAGGAGKYRIFQWASQVAREYARTYQAAERDTGTGTVPLGLRIRHALADRLVYRQIRQALGGRLRACVSGSAALPADIGYFFAGAGVPVLEGYGLTESSAATACNLEDVRTGTCGRLFPGTEAKVAEDGEVLLRGPGIMRGYHGQPEKTAEALDEDGWLRTGDIGELSEDGFLKITDRKKDLIKTSGGKYVSPTELEGQFKALCPYAANVIVIGDSRNYCSALITLDEQAIREWGAEHGQPNASYAELCASDQVHQLIDGYVQELNTHLQRWQTIKRFTIPQRDFDLEHGEVTPSMKVKRAVVQRSFSDEIENMYTGTREG